MKIKQFLKENITVFLSYIIIFILYRKLLGSSFALLLTIFFAAYGSAVVASQYGKSKMIYLEKAGMLTTKKTVLLFHTDATSHLLVLVSFFYHPRAFL